MRGLGSTAPARIPSKTLAETSAKVAELAELAELAAELAESWPDGAHGA